MLAGWIVLAAGLTGLGAFWAAPAHALTPADCDPYIETWWGSTDPQNPTGGGCELKLGYELSAVEGGWRLSVGVSPGGTRAPSAVVPAAYKGQAVVQAQIWSIRSVDLSRATNLKTLDVDNEDYADWVAHLDLSGARNLAELYITAPNLDALDLASNAELQIVELLRTKVDRLDLTKQAKLSELRLYDTPITALNLTAQGKLTSLALENNSVTTLDLSANTGLKSLDVKKTRIASLAGSLAKLPKLESLTLVQNQLKSLDLRKNPRLGDLRVAEAGLTSMNLSKNKALTALFMTDVDDETSEAFYSTSLKKLDVSKNRKLVQLAVEGAASLKKLDVSKLNRMTDLFFQRVPGLKVKVSKANNPRLELVTYSPKSLNSEKTSFGPRWAKWKKKTFVNAQK